MDLLILHFKMLKNSKVDVKIKLAALWATLMFFYTYADFFDGMTPSSIENFGSMQTPVGPLTPGLLVIFSILLIIPSAMIFLSVFLKPILNKWINVVIAALWSMMSIGLLVDTIGSEWYRFYALYQIVEIGVLLMIVWQALQWPKGLANSK